MLTVLRSPSEDYVGPVLEAAVLEDNSWGVVMQLMSLGTDAAQRDSLFHEMIK